MRKAAALAGCGLGCAGPDADQRFVEPTSGGGGRRLEPRARLALALHATRAGIGHGEAGRCPPRFAHFGQAEVALHGWDVDRDAERLRPLIAEAHASGVRVSLFMDPVPEAMAKVRALGADRVELYTEGYARAHGTPGQARVLDQYARTARAALAVGLGVNAGHDLSLANLTDFVRAVPGLAEVSIGHALIADALEFGLGDTVRRYLRAIAAAESAETLA